MSDPSAAPQNVRGKSISSTSILVRWDGIPAADQNGIITGYKIRYHSLSETDNSTAAVDYPARQVKLRGLREFVNYSITVFASTGVGDGPASNPVYVRTDEDSKCFLLILGIRLIFVW